MALGSEMNFILCTTSLYANFSFNLSPQPNVSVISWSDSACWYLRGHLSAEPLSSLYNFIYKRSLGRLPEVTVPLPGLSCSVSSSDGTACLFYRCCCCCCQDTNTDKLHILAHTTNTETEGEQAARQIDWRSGRNGGKRAPPWAAVTEGAGW